jgi:ribosomal-protein-alanine N-acetyltransferase
MTTHDIRVRDMHWWDIEAAHHIEQQVFEGTAWAAETFWSELGGVPETRRYLVATEGGVIVGYGGVRTVSPDADVQTLAVARNARRQGIGQQILNLLTEHVKAAGCTRLHLEVAADNEAAQSLYAANGFTVQTRRSSYFGAGRDALVMRRSLSRTPS